jgi:hypothetical protein
VTIGGSPVGTVTLDCEAVGPSGTVVNLSTDLPGVAAPAFPTVTVQPGDLTATFTINTSAPGTALIGADTGTGGPQQAPLVVANLGT